MKADLSDTIDQFKGMSVLILASSGSIILTIKGRFMVRLLQTVGTYLFTRKGSTVLMNI